ncbi:MAG: glycosyltransferase family 39 protein, partial [Promethearchaeota archaeon]
MSDQIAQKIKYLYTSNKLPWIIIGVGIVLRLVRYLYNPSLWFDESDIAIDIISRPISELINPSPDYNQAYPLAFMILIKLSTQVLGTSEYVIRLIPLIASIIALFLFYRVVKSYLEPNAVLIALGLFAISDSLVFQSSNLKPYSSDVLFTLLIFTLTIYVQSMKLNMPSIILFGISGAIAIWFSNPSVFVLAGVGASLGAFCLINKDWKEIGKLSISYSIWALSFIANYLLYIRNLQANFSVDMDWMLALQDAYMPFPPASLAEIKWFTELFFDIFSNPLAMTLTGIAAFSFLVGCVSFYTQKRRIFIILISPIVITFLAAALHEYAFKGRFIFFLLPLLLLIIAEGAEYIRSIICQNSRIIGIIFILLLFFHPLSLSAYRIIKPFYWEDIKPVMKYVKDNWQKGDI